MIIDQGLYEQCLSGLKRFADVGDGTFSDGLDKVLGLLGIEVGKLMVDEALVETVIQVLKEANIDINKPIGECVRDNECRVISFGALLELGQAVRRFMALDE